MAAGNLTKQEARERAQLISEVSYEIDLDLTTVEDTFGSDTTIRFKCSEPGATTFLDLAAPDVLQIVFNGKEVSLDACQNRRILITGTKAENEMRIKATCKYSHTGYGLHRFTDPTDGTVYTYSDFEPFQANRVFPCFDQPDLKATFDIRVSAPIDWTVISNMPVAESNQGRWRFEQTPRMSTYLAAVVAGPYHGVFETHDGIELGVYCRQSLAQFLDAGEFLEITKQGFDYYHGAFDYRYPFGKYDQVMVPEFNAGAMENAGCVTFNERYIYRSRVTDATRERRAEVILHEMAHMWFGDLVTMRWWDDLWLNESFATFMALLSQDVTRFKNGWVTFANDVKTAARRQDQLPTTHPIVSDVPDTQSTRVMFDAIAYNKGSAVLRQLFAWVGEKAFFEGIKVYFRRHEFGNTDLTDFLAALEESSGRDLKAWAKEWLETSGLNTLEPSFELEDGAYRSFAIEQDAQPRSHRLAIGVYDSTGEGLALRRRVELDVTGEKTEVPELVGEQAGDLVLLNEGDLAYAKVRPDEKSLQTIKSRLSDLGDPLARALAWAMAWDLLYDGVISASDYVDLVVNHAGNESDLSILQTLTDKPRSINAGIALFLLGQTRVATLVYGDPAKASSRSESLAAAAQRFFEASEPGGDFQLMWFRFFSGTAATSEQRSFLGDVLEGRRHIEGCIVDHELRWWILQSLAAAGEAHQSQIDAELERDPTDAGKRFGLTALAAIPTEEQKARAWSRIVDDESLPRADMVALMAGWQHPAHAALLEPYREKYFEVLPEIWESREEEVSTAFASLMYPHFVIDEATLHRTDEYLETGPPASLRRILLEGREGVTRAMTTRDRDSRP